MRTAVFWAVTLVIALVLIGLTRSDYHIPLRNQYALFGNDAGNGSVFLTHRGTRVIDDVLAYRNLDDIVIGESREGYFVAETDGTTNTFGSRSEWLSHVTSAFPDFGGHLAAPSRVRDPIWRLMAGGTGLALICWLIIGLWVSRKASARQPQASSGEEPSTAV